MRRYRALPLNRHESRTAAFCGQGILELLPEGWQNADFFKAPKTNTVRILFIHNNFPAQYRHIAAALAKDPKHQVGFLTQSKTGDIPGVTKVLFEPTRKAHESTHTYVKLFENAVLEAQAVVRVLQQLQNKGFVPDLICAHTGWGCGMFVKDVFPNTPLLLYCEWYSQSGGGDFDFDPRQMPALDAVLRYRASNAAMLVDLTACDTGIAPTEWQKSRFPNDFQHKIDVLHDGIDTQYFQPQTAAKLKLPHLDLTQADEIVTYVARGMDSYRGFPQFIEALARLQKQRPQCHAVIVADDRIAYGNKPPEGDSWKTYMLAKTPLDKERVHFTGSLPYGLYKQVLQASSVHVYLTKPFVLSWSFLEAMACGCLMVASDTAPVREVLEAGRNGLLVDFFDSQGLAEKIAQALSLNAEESIRLRQNARHTVESDYALSRLLPKQLALCQKLAAAGLA